jgi:hypothetical protein
VTALAQRAVCGLGWLSLLSACGFASVRVDCARVCVGVHHPFTQQQSLIVDALVPLCASPPPTPTTAQSVRVLLAYTAEAGPPPGRGLSKLLNSSDADVLAALSATANSSSSGDSSSNAAVRVVTPWARCRFQDSNGYNCDSYAYAGTFSCVTLEHEYNYDCSGCACTSAAAAAVAARPPSSPASSSTTTVTTTAATITPRNSNSNNATSVTSSQSSSGGTGATATTDGAVAPVRGPAAPGLAVVEEAAAASATGAADGGDSPTTPPPPSLGEPAPRAPLVVRRGRRLDVVVPENLYTAAHLAAFRGHLPILRALVDEAGNSVRRVALDGASPMALAAHAGHMHVVQFLLQQERAWLQQQKQSGANSDVDAAAAAERDHDHDHDVLQRFYVHSGADSLGDGSVAAAEAAAAEAGAAAAAVPPPPPPPPVLPLSSSLLELVRRKSNLDPRLQTGQGGVRTCPIFAALAASRLDIAAALLESGLHWPDEAFEDAVGSTSLLLATVYALTPVVQLQAPLERGTVNSGNNMMMMMMNGMNGGVVSAGAVSSAANASAAEAEATRTRRDDTGMLLRVIRLLLLRRARVDAAATKALSFVLNGTAVQVEPGMTPLQVAIDAHALDMLRLLLVHDACGAYRPGTFVAADLMGRRNGGRVGDSDSSSGGSTTSCSDGDGSVAAAVVADAAARLTAAAAVQGAKAGRDGHDGHGSVFSRNRHNSTLWQVSSYASLLCEVMQPSAVAQRLLDEVGGSTVKKHSPAATPREASSSAATPSSSTWSVPPASLALLQRAAEGQLAEDEHTAALDGVRRSSGRPGGGDGSGSGYDGADGDRQEHAHDACSCDESDADCSEACRGSSSSNGSRGHATGDDRSGSAVAAQGGGDGPDGSRGKWRVLVCEAGTDCDGHELLLRAAVETLAAWDEEDRDGRESNAAAAGALLLVALVAALAYGPVASTLRRKQTKPATTTRDSGGSLEQSAEGAASADNVGSGSGGGGDGISSGLPRKKKPGGSGVEGLAASERSIVDLLQRLSTRLTAQYAKPGAAEPSRRVTAALDVALAEMGRVLGSCAPPRLQQGEVGVGGLEAQRLDSGSGLPSHQGLGTGSTPGLPPRTRRQSRSRSESESSTATAESSVSGFASSSSSSSSGLSSSSSPSPNRVIRQRDAYALQLANEKRVSELLAAITTLQRRAETLQAMHARSVERNTILERQLEQHDKVVGQLNKRVEDADARAATGTVGLQHSLNQALGRVFQLEQEVKKLKQEQVRAAGEARDTIHKLKKALHKQQQQQQGPAAVAQSAMPGDYQQQLKQMAMQGQHPQDLHLHQHPHNAPYAQAQQQQQQQQQPQPYQHLAWANGGDGGPTSERADQHIRRSRASQRSKGRQGKVAGQVGSSNNGQHHGQARQQGYTANYASIVAGATGNAGSGTTSSSGGEGGGDGGGGAGSGGGGDGSHSAARANSNGHGKFNNSRSPAGFAADHQRPAHSLSSSHSHGPLPAPGASRIAKNSRTFVPASAAHAGGLVEDHDDSAATRRALAGASSSSSSRTTRSSAASTPVRVADDGSMLDLDGGDSSITSTPADPPTPTLLSSSIWGTGSNGAGDPASVPLLDLDLDELDIDAGRETIEKFLRFDPAAALALRDKNGGANLGDECAGFSDGADTSGASGGGGGGLHAPVGGNGNGPDSSDADGTGGGSLGATGRGDGADGMYGGFDLTALGSLADTDEFADGAPTAERGTDTGRPRLGITWGLVTGGLR